MAHIFGLANVFFFYFLSYCVSYLIYFFRFRVIAEIPFYLLPDFILEELRFIVPARFLAKSRSFIVTLWLLKFTWLFSAVVLYLWDSFSFFSSFCSSNLSTKVKLQFSKSCSLLLTSFIESSIEFCLS